MSAQRPLSRVREQIFPGDSELARRMRDFDRGRTPLGPVESWPGTLMHYVAMILELAQRLRAMNGISPELRLVAVTGYGLERDRERSVAAGFDAHIVKPVDIRNLVQICRP